MHPLLRTPKQLLIMGILWIPICFWVVFLLYSLVDIPFENACILAGPPMVVELFICLSTWYTTKAITIKKSPPLKIIGMHVLPAGILAGAWLLLIMLYSQGLDLILKTSQWLDFYLEALPMFSAVGLSLYAMAALVHYLIWIMDMNRKNEEEALKQKILTGQAELKALKATIHPHFLFNCLNMLNPLMRISVDRAQTVVSQLSEFLLYSLRYGKQELVTVKEELDHIKNYLSIEHVRLGERLRTGFDVDEILHNCLMPPLVLLPLVENAVKHGISQCIEGGILEISIKAEGDKIRIQITNPYDEPSRPLKGEGLGVQTMAQRISAFYGSEGKLSIMKKDNIFRVMLVFPKEIVEVIDSKESMEGIVKSVMKKMNKK